MIKFNKVIVGILIFVMATTLLYGCAPKETETSPSPSDNADATTDASAPHEIYTVDNRLPWSGLLNPDMASRADIDKAIKPDNKKDDITVGYVTWTNGTPFFAAMSATLKAECDKYGWEFVSAVSDADIAKQVAAIENMVTLGVDIIIDNDWSIDAESVAIKAAVEAGIPVIGLGLPFPDSTPVITTAATNYYEQGFLVGQLAAQQYKDVAVKAATLPGLIGHPIAESKLNGFIGGFVYERAIQMDKPFATKEDAMLYGYNLEQKIVKSASFSDADFNWEVVASIDGSWSQDGGQKAMEDIITAHPDINLVFTDNDQEGFGAIKAMQQAGMNVGTDVQIVSVGDGTKEALQLIKDGTYLGITLASPYTCAKACTDLANMIFNEGFDATNLPGSVQLDNILVTIDNVDEWMPTDEYTTLPDQVFTPIS